MKRIRFRLPVLAGAVLFALSAQPSKTPPAPAITVPGVFLGHSGKPMAKARLLLGEVEPDNEFQYARIKLVAKVPDAIADAKGQFQFRNVTPGVYTILYSPTGASLLVQNVISIRALSAETRSMLPMMRNVEVGKSFEPLAERAWGQAFTLLKGHTFWSMGANMKIWNATARWRQAGPFVEVRKGIIWLERIDAKTQIKFEAWSY